MTRTRRHAWIIVRAMAAELERQHREGLLNNLNPLDDSGHMYAAGTIDLAALANITERAIRSEFGIS